MVDCLLLRGRGARGEISHEIWRRTIPSEALRPCLELGAEVQGRTLSTYIAEMCGRFTRNYTWEQIRALYRLTAPAIPNLQPRLNACPTEGGAMKVRLRSQIAAPRVAAPHRFSLCQSSYWFFGDRP